MRERFRQSREARVRKAHEALGLTWSPPGCTEGQTLWRAVYLPSFHAPLTVTFRGGPDAELRLTWQEYTEPKKPPTLAQRTLRVPEAAATALDAKLTGLQPWELQLEDRMGADGITVHGTVCSPSHGETHFTAWSPNENNGPRHQRYFLTLLEASLELLAEDPLTFQIEPVQGYLTNEMLAKDLGGSPRVVRLAAGYSIDHLEPLKQFLAAIPQTEDVIVDLRSFDGAGTALKPLFVAFDTRAKARTVWVIPGDGAAYLSKYLGVRRSHVVTTMEAARKRLTPKR